MSKKIVSIAIIGIALLMAGIAVWFLLHPASGEQNASNPGFDDSWKLERIQGSWASDGSEYEFYIDGHDFTLKHNGVYAMVASLQFDASETPQEGAVRFALQVDPYSVIYPDANGTDRCEIAELWYENDMIWMLLVGPEGTDAEPICLLSV